LDDEKLLPGQDWNLEIEKAVETADAVVVCISSKSVSKEGYIQRELRHALDIALEKPEGTIFIISLRLEECTVLPRLQRWQWINYYEDRGHERLMQAFRTRAVDLGIASSILARAAPWIGRLVVEFFANWSHDEYWSPTKIRSFEGDQVFVRFDDGDKEWIARDHLMPIDLEVGDAVVCKYKSGLYYFQAHRLQMEGERISVQYNYDATTSPDDPVPRVDCSSHFLLPPGWGMHSTTR